ncbi:hypothetical protein Fmac_014418 [Flemingia macrophylla]|uniref:Uncharacterized protein n=1 Tax=Flemingia macrophylla TaxID=520843 RepID=A0ABD1MBN5_9FABA
MQDAGVEFQSYMQSREDSRFHLLQLGAKTVVEENCGLITKCRFKVEPNICCDTRLFMEGRNMFIFQQVQMSYEQLTTTITTRAGMVIIETHGNCVWPSNNPRSKFGGTTHR